MAVTVFQARGGLERPQVGQVDGVQPGQGAGIRRPGCDLHVHFAQTAPFAHIDIGRFALDRQFQALGRNTLEPGLTDGQPAFPAGQSPGAGDRPQVGQRQADQLGDAVGVGGLEVELEIDALIRDFLFLHGGVFVLVDDVVDPPVDLEVEALAVPHGHLDVGHADDAVLVDVLPAAPHRTQIRQVDVEQGREVGRPGGEKPAVGFIARGHAVLG